MSATTKILKSKHGKSLLRELNDKNGNKDKIFNFVNQDEFAARYKDAETGDNSFHLLLQNGPNNDWYSNDFVIEVLKFFIEKSPKGLDDKNNNGMLPIHIAMYQRVISEEAVYLILQANPNCAKICTNALLLIPLFYAVMRDNASYPLVKFLCDVYPDGVKHKNKTNSLPIHFACKRRYPNYSIVKLLVNLYPGSLLCQNYYSWHPLHCLCSSTDNLKVVKLVHEACVDAVTIQDRQGRTCLHLATLLIGKDHQNAIRDVMLNDEDMTSDETQNYEMRNYFTTSTNNSNASSNSIKILSNQLNFMSLNNKTKGSIEQINENEISDDDSDSDYDDNNMGNSSINNSNNTATTSTNNGITNLNATQEIGQFNRKVLYYLIHQYPLSLIISNNFQSTPVETVLEKVNSINHMKAMKNKYKQILTWGLYDDPITARILLSLQNHYYLIKMISRGLKLQQIKILHELNWINRKYALLASYGNHVSYFLKNNSSTSTIAVSASSSNNSNKNNTKNNRSKGGGGGSTGTKTNKKNQNIVVTTSSNIHNIVHDPDQSLLNQLVISADKNNVLYKLRLRGLNECIRICISFI